MLGVFIASTKIRPYTGEDFAQLAQVYKSAFAEPPWNEYYKCGNCGVNYGRDEIRNDILAIRGGDNKPRNYSLTKAIYDNCKNCGIDLSPEIAAERYGEAYFVKNTNLMPFWSDVEIKKDIGFASLQDKPLILVAEDNNKLLGFTWGYKLPLEKFPFLKDTVCQNSNYMDEIAVCGDARIKGLGTILGEEYINTCKNQDINQIVLRTDERNAASMALFRKLGFIPAISKGATVYDPQYPTRIYLSRDL